jgi:hypothetical protein
MAEADCGATTFTVHRGAWTDPEVAAMVAPPVTVTSARIERPVDPWRRGQLARARANMPVGRHRGPAR